MSSNTSISPPKSIEEGTVRESILEETTTTNIYWDVGFEFEFTKYTEEDARVSHSLVRMGADGEAVALIESWAPAKVFAPDELTSLSGVDIADFLGDHARQAWMHQAVLCASLDERDAHHLGREEGIGVVCVWRYYHDHDDDLILGQRFVLAEGYASFTRTPLQSCRGRIKSREVISGGGPA
jgi:hypothetical protein